MGTDVPPEESRRFLRIHEAFKAGDLAALRAECSQQLDVELGARHAGDFMTIRDQERDDPASDHTARAGQEDPHGDLV